MNIAAKNVVAKLSVAVVAAAMLLMIAAPAKAATVEELQAQIAALMAQISSLSGGSSAPAAGCTFTGALTLGSEGAQVTCLQNYLIGAGFTISAGATGYFGGQTAAAVAAWQSANGVMPAAGYFGPVSQAKYNALVAAGGGSSTPGSDDSGNDNSDLSGDGSLSDFQVDDEQDEAMEGSEDTEIATLTLGAEDGDIEVDRLAFTLAGANSPTEHRAWKAFDDVTLWVDGDKVASFDASDRDEYLDEDDGTFRFTNLGLVVREDEQVEVTVAVSVPSSVDGAGSDADWTLTPTEIRYFDADGVASTEDDSPAFDELGTDVDFSITQEGADDGATVKSSSDNPDASTILVDENDKSDEVTVHTFTLDVDKDSADLDVNDVFADVTISNPTGNADITGGQRQVVDAVYMTIDGEQVKGRAVASADSGNDDDSDAIASSSATIVTYKFEFDGDVTLNGDEEYDSEISMVFKGQDDNYENGVTVETYVDGTTWEVEGEASDNELDGDDSSETHTLSTVVPVIDDTSFEVDRNEAGDAGTISYQFTIKADGDNDVDFNFGDTTDVDGAADDLKFTLSGKNTAIASAQISLLSGDADEIGSDEGWTIADGDEATFVLDVTFTTASSSDNGTYRVTVDTIEGVKIDETSTGLSLTK